jgi:uncharacterized protein YdeI (YjbR/CyaY-like superfamily)
MNPLFFKTENDFRKWLEKNHLKKTKLLVGFYKVDSGKPSMTWSQSVDQALCFGWIDGIRKSIDTESYCIRFTPRKPKSIWSTININKVAALIKLKLMRPEGIAAFEKREAAKSAIYAYETTEKKLSAAFERKFKANKTAWTNFNAMAQSYKRTAIHWVITAKQESTRINRLTALIADSEKNIKVKPFRW